MKQTVRVKYRAPKAILHLTLPHEFAREIVGHGDSYTSSLLEDGFQEVM